MLQTIVTASHISVQGELVKKLADGRVMVRVGAMEFIGMPIRALRRRRRTLKAV
ncbi:hypothetical protein ACW9UR_10615 [Halovulum sp. GXIMD14794]